MDKFAEGMHGPDMHSRPQQFPKYSLETAICKCEFDETNGANLKKRVICISLIKFVYNHVLFLHANLFVFLFIIRPLISEEGGLIFCKYVSGYVGILRGTLKA